MSDVPEEAQVTTLHSNSKSPIKKVLFGIGLLVVFSVLFMSGYIFRASQFIQPPVYRQNFASKLFNTQYASLNGSLIKINGNNVTVKNNNNIEESFRLADKYNIIKRVDKTLKNYQNDKAQLELNRPAYILVQYLGNSYQIVSITY